MHKNWINELIIKMSNRVASIGCAVGIFFLMYGQCYSATYYVDFLAGLDNNNGTSSSTAWKHCPGDTNATGTAFATTLSGGDTVIFKGGVTYIVSKYIEVKWSGTSDANRITYDGNSAGNWGAGKAVVTDNYALGNSAFYTASSRNYITIRNFTIQNFGGSATIPADTGSPVVRRPGHSVRFDGGSTGLTIDSCDFSAIGYWFNQKPMDANAISGVGVQAINPNSLIISNCNFTKMNIGVEAYYTGTRSGLTITNCTFHDYMTWPIDISAGSGQANVSSIDINGCTFFNYNQFDSTNWKGYGEWPHTDGIYIREDYDGTSFAGIKIRNNLFYSTDSVAGGSASITLSNGPSANIYNNIFLHDQKTNVIYIHGGKFPTSPSQTVNIFNNTFFSDYQNVISLQDAGSLIPAGVTVKNNIFYDYRQGSGGNFIVVISSAGSERNWLFDYNIYKTFNSNGYFYSWNGVETGNLTTMKARGWETNGKAADPLFVDISHGIGIDVTRNNLQLRSGSPAKSAGANLSTFFTTDMLGTSRPQSANWDLGAYQGVTPPDNLRLSP